MLIFLIATYLFVLGEKFFDNWTFAKQNEATTDQYKNAWQYLYKQESKKGKKKMDSVLLKDYK